MGEAVSPRGFVFGPFTLDLDALALTRDGVAVELRPKAFDTLRVLVERAGHLVSRNISWLRSGPR
jgi:DNA-binding winged helix-turn-helix (wHTH) protein